MYREGSARSLRVFLIMGVSTPCPTTHRHFTHRSNSDDDVTRFEVHFLLEQYDGLQIDEVFTSVLPSEMDSLWSSRFLETIQSARRNA